MQFAFVYMLNHLQLKKFQFYLSENSTEDGEGQEVAEGPGADHGFSVEELWEVQEVESGELETWDQGFIQGRRSMMIRNWMISHGKPLACLGIITSLGGKAQHAM